MEKQIDLTEKVIGLPFSECFICGKPDSTRHHAIPKEMKPLRNVTLPLCDEHKDVTHLPVRVLYVPPELRQAINKALVEVNNTKGRLVKVKKSFNIGKRIKTTSNPIIK